MKVVLTYKDYAVLPDDGRRYEIHDGELSVTPAPSPQHQIASLNLALALNAYVVARHLGQIVPAPVDVILSPTTIVQPDIVFVARDDLDRITARGIETPPSLVIEILSPSTEPIDRYTKFEFYARHGVTYYWIADPATRVVEAYALRGDVYDLAARGAGDAPFALPPFPDLRLDPAALRPRPLP